MSSIKSLVGIQLQQNYQMLVILDLLQTDTYLVCSKPISVQNESEFSKMFDKRQLNSE